MPQAVEVAIENAGLNGVAALCRFVTSIGLQAPELAARAPYDLIVANILAGPLMELSESFAAATRPGGRVLLSGLLVEQADMIVSTYGRRGFAARAPHRPRDRRRVVAHLAAAQTGHKKGPAFAGPFVRLRYATRLTSQARPAQKMAGRSLRFARETAAACAAVELRHRRPRPAPRARRTGSRRG